MVLHGATTLGGLSWWRFGVPHRESRAPPPRRCIVHESNNKVSKRGFQNLAEDNTAFTALVSHPGPEMASFPANNTGTPAQTTVTALRHGVMASQRPAFSCAERKICHFAVSAPVKATKSRAEGWFGKKDFQPAPACATNGFHRKSAVSACLRRILGALQRVQPLKQ